jgi:NAD(P)-dependent dehydrogenase (short-subunit alcohol dehydrogenase family)
MAVAIITGASRGLGLALAAGLASAGWRLVVDARGAGDLADAVQEIRAGAAGTDRIVAVPGDVTDAAHRLALIEAADRLGGLDLLVNNAGILGPSPQPALAEYALSALRDVYEVNVVAPLGLIQVALPALRASRGAVVNITSDAAVEAYPGWGGYGSAKAAIEQASRILAAEEPELRVWWVDPAICVPGCIKRHSRARTSATGRCPAPSCPPSAGCSPTRRRPGASASPICSPGPPSDSPG